ncbi:MAG TPA: hypothetical protein VE998_12455 [Terriglobales bacterium]|nr:hypothetical protein [Terriglobales bacterium]
MPFQQAQIPIEKQQEFQRLRSAIERAIAPGTAAEFLKQVKKAGLKVRNFEGVLEARVLERCDRELAAAGARQLYETLRLPEQSLIREFYLERIEQVDGPERERYRQLYIDLV